MKQGITAVVSIVVWMLIVLLIVLSGGDYALPFDYELGDFHPLGTKDNVVTWISEDKATIMIEPYDKVIAPFKEWYYPQKEEINDYVQEYYRCKFKAEFGLK